MRERDRWSQVDIVDVDEKVSVVGEDVYSPQESNWFRKKKGMGVFVCG